MGVTLFISVWLMIRAMRVLSSIVITQILEQALFLRDVDSLFRYSTVFCYIASSVGGQDELNPALLLAGFSAASHDPLFTKLLLTKLFFCLVN